MKISKKEVIILVSVIFVISAAVYIYYFLMPTLKEIEINDIAIAQKTQKIESMKLDIAKIDSIEEQIALLEDELAVQTRDIPVGISQPLQLAAITSILNEKGDTVNIKFSSSAETFENYQKNIVNVNFATTYEKLLKILDGFSKLYMTNQIVDMRAMYTQDTLEFFTQVSLGNYLIIDMTVEFYSFYSGPGAQPPEKQDFEKNSRITGKKNPFYSS